MGGATLVVNEGAEMHACPDVHAARHLVEMLACWRINSGLTRTEVARRMGTSRAMVSRIEEDPDRYCAQMKTYQRYARAVGMPLVFALPLPPGGLTLITGTEEGGAHARYQHSIPAGKPVAAGAAGDPCQI